MFGKFQWLKIYIEFNIEKRKNSCNDFFKKVLRVEE